MPVQQVHRGTHPAIAEAVCTPAAIAGIDTRRQLKEYAMNARSTSSLFAALALSAGSALADAPASGTLDWDCTRRGAPTYQEIKASFGIANFHLAQQAAVQVNLIVKRACKREVDRVLVVERGGQGAERFALATR
jgi:hypothetical protein